VLAELRRLELGLEEPKRRRLLGRGADPGADADPGAIADADADA